MAYDAAKMQEEKNSGFYHNPLLKLLRRRAAPCVSKVRVVGKVNGTSAVVKVWYHSLAFICLPALMKYKAQDEKINKKAVECLLISQS